MGAVEENIVKQAKRAGDPIPDRIKNKPRLSVASLFFYTSWHELGSDRPVGWGVGAIPWSSMHYYALAHNLTGEDYDDFMYLVRALDKGYIQYVQSKEPA